jgi:hypothetical protein
MLTYKVCLILHRSNGLNNFHNGIETDWCLIHATAFFHNENIYHMADNTLLIDGKLINYTTDPIRYYDMDCELNSVVNTMFGIQSTECIIPRCIDNLRQFKQFGIGVARKSELLTMEYIKSIKSMTNPSNEVQIKRAMYAAIGFRPSPGSKYKTKYCSVYLGYGEFKTFEYRDDILVR